MKKQEFYLKILLTKLQAKKCNKNIWKQITHQKSWREKAGKWL